MEKLADIVSRDYEEELTNIRAAGKIWSCAASCVAAVAGLWAVDTFLGEPWGQERYLWTVAFVCIFPFIWREWNRHQMILKLRHHREVRVEVKVDVLLGITKIADE
jgi:hypothetical protein